MNFFYKQFALMRQMNNKDKLQKFKKSTILVFRHLTFVGKHFPERNKNKGNLLLSCLWTADQSKRIWFKSKSMLLKIVVLVLLFWILFPKSFHNLYMTSKLVSFRTSILILMKEWHLNKFSRILSNILMNWQIHKKRGMF